MLSRIESHIRFLLRFLSRNVWAQRLLRLDEIDAARTKPGIIMIQIDGLSHRQLLSAIKNRKMPFLGRLLKRENYQLHDLYSGIPSTTPAIQGEIFYGIPACVPAFAYYDRVDKRVRKMFEPSSTIKVEQRLKNEGEALFSNGSIYSDVFTGGAKEAHFCPAAASLSKLIRSANPFSLAFLVFCHIDSVIRIGVLTIVELLLALMDFFKGTFAGEKFRDELKFIFTRIGLCIVLRELISIGARIDIARGLPTIHLNLIGYDEQAHRRGPTSAFAHWTLRGIDRVVSRIWRSSHRSTARDYEVWIYSDHGQQEVISYPTMHNIPIDRAIERVIQQFTDTRLSVNSFFTTSHATDREVRFKSARSSEVIASNMDAGAREKATNDQKPELHVVAVGPVGFVYCDGVSGEQRWREIAMALVAEAHLPMVLRKTGDKSVTAWTKNGEFTLPSQAARVLGNGHPFLEEVTNDLIHLCHHKDAGDLVFSGWHPKEQPCSFGNENGAHAGPGFDETHAFALLPGDTAIKHGSENYLRPVSLRNAAQRLLQDDSGQKQSIAWNTTTPRRRLRLMTYNVHMCIGMDGKASPERIARVINSYRPDIVCLQEIDVNIRRTGHVDQAHEIASLLQMNRHFHPSLNLEHGKFGNAILTALPMRLVRAAGLPTHPDRQDLDPRGAIWATVKFAGQNIQLINTHLGLYPRERAEQIQALTSEQWLNHPQCVGPRLLCGDFNATAKSAVGQQLSRHLKDSQASLTGHKAKNTFFGRYPVTRIDHVYVEKRFTVKSVIVGDSTLARSASDHLPLVIEIEPADRIDN